MAIEIEGITGAHAMKIRRWCEEAFAEFGLTPEV